MPKFAARISCAAAIAAIFLFSNSLSAQDNKVFRFSHEPGVYGKPIFLSIYETGAKNESAEGKFLYRFSGSSESSFLPYVQSLHLNALPGEDRTFRIELRSLKEQEVKELLFRIDRRAPAPPSISTELQDNALKLRIETADEEDIAYTAFRSSFDDKGGFRRFEGKRIDFSLPLPPHVFSADIYAYSVDTRGNIGEIGTKRVLRPQVEESCKEPLRILSPVEGDFANLQKLVLDSTDCFEWIRYSIDGSDPSSRGKPYDGPLILDQRGDVLLRVAAKKRGEDGVYRSQLRYSVANTVPDISFPFPEKMDSSELRIPAPRSDDFNFHYCLDERAADLRDKEFTSPLSIEFKSPSVHGLPLRLLAIDRRDGSSYQFRYYYRYDNRIPSAPQILLSKELPITDRIEVVFLAEREAEIYYSTDGSTPDRFSRRYTGPVLLEVPRNSSAGSITVRAIARLKNGRTGEVASKVVIYDYSRPQKPEILIDDSDSLGFGFRVNAPPETRKIRYELRYGSKEGDSIRVEKNSPLGKREMYLSFPYGYAGAAVLRVAVEDGAGNLSLSSDPVSFGVDTVPPPPPKVRIDETQTVSIDSGGADIRYALFAGDRPEQIEEMYPAEEDFEDYTGPFSLEINVDSGKDYVYFVVFAYSLDENGNRSALAGSDLHAVDRRKNRGPIFSGVEEGGRYASERIIHLLSPQRGGKVFYEIEEITKNGDNLSPPLPDGDSPVADSPILFSGREDEEVDYRVAARVRLSAGGKWSEVKTRSFTIDRRAPQAPSLELPADGPKYSLPIEIPPQQREEGEEVWLLVLSGDEETSQVKPEDIRRRGRPLVGPMIVGPEKGERKEYHLYAAALDKVGNYSSPVGPVSCVIDRRVHALPPLTGMPANGLAGEAVTLELSDPESIADETRLVYEISLDSTEPRVPDKDSPAFEPPITLRPKEGRLSEIIIRYRAMDSRGRLSEEIGRIYFAIDDRRIEAPAISLSREGDARYLLRLSTEKSCGRFFYGFSPDAAIAYKGPVSLDLRAMESTTVYAKTVSESGLESETAHTIIGRTAGEGGALLGIEDGGVYRNDIKLRTTEKLRYELNRFDPKREKDFEAVHEIDVFSPELKNGLILDAPEGRETGYVLSVGRFDEESGIGSRVKTYRVRIDKAAPLPPKIIGIKHNAYYTGAPAVRFDAEEGAEVFYRLEKNGKQTGDFARAENELRLETAPGKIDTYALYSYSIDAAGNRSSTEKVVCTVDRAGIYVSSFGKDSFDGSRGRPFRSIDRALYEAEVSERSTIYLASGTYGLREPLQLERRELTIKGGFSPQSWEYEGGETLLSVGDARYPKSEALVSSNNGRITLEGLTLTNSDIEGSVLSQEGRGAKITLREVLLVHTAGTNAPLLRAKYGSIEILDSRVELGPVRNASVFSLEDADFSLRSSEIVGGDDGGSITFLTALRCKIKIEDGSLHPGRGVDTSSILARNSSIALLKSEVSAGKGSSRAEALHIEGGELYIEDSLIRGERGTRLSVAVASESAKVDIRRTRIELPGGVGGVALSTRGGSVKAEDCRLSAGSFSEFFYLLRSDRSSLRMENCLLTAERGEELKGLEMNGGRAEFRNSTFSFGAADSIFRAFSLNEGAELRLNRSVIAYAGANGTDGLENGSAINLLDTSTAELTENIFSGMSTVLILPSGEKRLDVEDLEKVRPPYDIKNPHKGNLEYPIGGLFVDPGTGEFGLRDRNLQGYGVQEKAGPDS